LPINEEIKMPKKDYKKGVILKKCPVCDYIIIFNKTKYLLKIKQETYNKMTHIRNLIQRIKDEGKIPEGNVMFLIEEIQRVYDENHTLRGKLSAQKSQITKYKNILEKIKNGKFKKRPKEKI